MQIKRFEAKNMSEALRLIKKELGADAVLLSARSLKKQNSLLGNWRTIGVEVTAAVDTVEYSGITPQRQAPASGPGARSAPAAARPVDSFRRQHAIHTYSRQSSGPARRPESKRNGPVRVHDGAPRASVHGLYRHLVVQDVEEALAGKLVAVMEAQLQAEQAAGPDDLNARFAAALEKVGIDTRPIRHNAGRRSIALFAGSSGVGKTATIVKLAGRLTMQERTRVAVISLDNQRIGGTEPLKACARILQVPFTAAGSDHQFKAALHQYRKADLVLVDTPALVKGEVRRIRQFLKQAADSKPVRTYLVCSATTRVSHNRQLLPLLKDLSPAGLIVTKLDESDTCGCLLNLAAGLQLPLSAVSRGPGRPEELLMAAPQLLAGLIMNRSKPAGDDFKASTRSLSTSEVIAKADRGQGDRRSAVADAQCPESYFVANMNSDVFHHPACRWTKMIKEENIIVFSSVSEAGQKHFKPCRSCCQDHLSLGRPSMRDDDRRRELLTG